MVCREEVMDIPYATIQECTAVEPVPQGATRRRPDVEGHFSCEVEGERDREFRLLEICDVVDERTDMPRVHETQPGRASQRHDHGVDDTVKTGVRRG